MSPFSSPACSESATTDLLILGASTRAAAESARRAGLRPICADRFGDVDLRRIALVLPLADYPHDLPQAVAEHPPTPWIYTGSLENEPALIDEISRRHPLLGNSSDVLRRVRDPLWIERTLNAQGLPALRTRHHDDPPPADGDWLVKPLRSGGGQAIRVWNGQRAACEEAVYFQERRVGRPMSALLMASNCGCELLGVCEQLIGRAEGAPTEFGYAGSIGPCTVPEGTRVELQRMGKTLTEAAELRGLFGIDFVWDHNTPWPTEINPRYTASVEVLERATRSAFLTRHVAACLTSGAASMPVCHKPPSQAVSCEERLLGKRIVFASREIFAPDLEAWSNKIITRGHEPWLADLPTPGSRIAAGWPICTVFAAADEPSACRRRLAERARLVHVALPNHSTTNPSNSHNTGH